MADSCVCVICDKKITASERKTVKERGIKNLIECSKQRMDNKWVKWLDQTSVVTHVSCHIKYISKAKIATAIKKILDKGTGETQASSSCESSLQEILADLNPTGFSFSTLCVICGDSCSIEKEKRMSKQRRRAISSVRSRSSWREHTLQLCNNDDDETLVSIKARIEPIQDLSAVGAKYHVSCAKQLNRRARSKGRSTSFRITRFSKQFEKLFRTLEKSEKCQWTFPDILKIFGDPAPTPKHIKNILVARYGDNIIFTSRGNRKTIITLNEVFNTL